MNILESIGHNISTLRRAKGLSQEKLALNAGLDRTYIPKVEKSKINITIKSLEKIANALNVDICELISNK